jgi:RNA polymerase sigma factor (sigma-70 family)
VDGARRTHLRAVSAETARCPDASLVERAREGDRAAFQALFERHRTMVVSLVRRAVGDPDLVDDVVQEAALSALIGIDRLRRPDHFGAWLAGIALNVCRRYRREMLRTASMSDHAIIDDADGGPDPSDVAIEREIARSVRSAIEGLPRSQREAATLFYLSGLTYRETALALGIDVGAVKARLHRARGRLGDRLSSLRKGDQMHREQAPDLVEVGVADVLRLPPDEGKGPEHVVMLEERAGSRRLPVWVGEPEATWLAHGVERIDLPRPGPYSMFASIVDTAGIRIREIRIEKLVDRTYYAVVIADREPPARIDARPSDALNLAVLTGAKVYVASDVFETGAMGLTSQYERLQAAIRDGTTVGAATIGSEARAAWQRSLEELTTDD